MQEVAPRAETTGCCDVNIFGGAAAVTGFLVENTKMSRPDYADRGLRTCVAETRLRADCRVKVVDAGPRTCINGNRCAKKYLYCAFSAV